MDTVQLCPVHSVTRIVRPRPQTIVLSCALSDELRDFVDRRFPELRDR